MSREHLYTILISGALCLAFFAFMSLISRLIQLDILGIPLTWSSFL